MEQKMDGKANYEQYTHLYAVDATLCNYTPS